MTISLWQIKNLTSNHFQNNRKCDVGHFLNSISNIYLLINSNQILLQSFFKKGFILYCIYHKYTLLENMVFFLLANLIKSTQFEQMSKRPLRHLGQINFDMSIMIGVVFFTRPFD
jgi:hypothetical protein